MSVPKIIPIPVMEDGGAQPKVLGDTAGTVVVIPVFKNSMLTLACLHSVRASLKPKDAVHVWVVNDASPEPDLVTSVSVFCQQAGFRYLERARNGGFPCAVNEALRHLIAHDAVLLNSDTLVAEGWLEALRKIAYAAPDTGTVTPLSNDASIFSYPDKNGANPVPDRSGVICTEPIFPSVIRPCTCVTSDAARSSIGISRIPSAIRQSMVVEGNATQNGILLSCAARAFR